MKNEKLPTNPVSQALYAEGLVPVPRLWVKPEDLELILYIAKPYVPIVKRITNMILIKHRRKPRFKRVSSDGTDT